MQVYRYGSVYLWEAHKQDHDGNKQPHVVRFPDRPDSAVQCLAGHRFIFTRRKKLDDPGAIIRPAQQQVEQDGSLEKGDDYVEHFDLKCYRVAGDD